MIVRMALAAGLAGCGQPEAVEVAADPSIVEDALGVTTPELLVDLVEETEQFGTAGIACPLVVTDGSEEVWTGGCSLDQGNSVEGNLRRFEDDTGAWIAAEHYAVRNANGELLFELNGSVELHEEDGLLQIQASGSLCGGEAWPCDDGVVSLDLAYTVYPATNFPNVYDATVSGVIGVEGEWPLTVDGVWSVDEAACANEPAQGTFTLRREAHHSLQLDGQSACDGCARWVVLGVEMAPYCGL